MPMEKKVETPLLVDLLMLDQYLILNVPQKKRLQKKETNLLIF